MFLKQKGIRRMKWTEKVVEQLKQLWADGLSTAEIGRHLGITKNAVIGKAHRLKLPSRPSPIRKTPKVKPIKPVSSKKTTTSKKTQATPTRSLSNTRRTQQSISPATATPPTIEKPQPKTNSPLPTEKITGKPSTRKKKSSPPPVSVSKSKIGKNAVLETEFSKRHSPTCCWPLGEPGTPEFHFCGAPPLSGKPYCEKHCQIAYVRLRPRGSRESKP